MTKSPIHIPVVATTTTATPSSKPIVNTVDPTKSVVTNAIHSPFVTAEKADVTTRTTTTEHLTPARHTVETKHSQTLNMGKYVSKEIFDEEEENTQDDKKFLG